MFWVCLSVGFGGLTRAEAGTGDPGAARQYETPLIVEDLGVLVLVSYGC